MSCNWENILIFCYFLFGVVYLAWRDFRHLISSSSNMSSFGKSFIRLSPPMQPLSPGLSWWREQDLLLRPWHKAIILPMKSPYSLRPKEARQMTSRALFKNSLCLQAKQSVRRTAVLFYGDCMKIYEDCALTFGDRRTSCKIWGFHAGDCEECHLLECYAMWLL
jgi:hypothetical protein